METTKQPQLQDVIRKEHLYTHPIEKVWKAISEADEITAWFIQADFKAEVGYNYKFTHEKSTVTGQVLEADPVHNLVYTWVVAGTTTETRVRWTLEEREEGTLLVLEHSGIKDYPPEMAINMFTSFNGGWDRCIGELARHLD